ncbi:MarR family winged helix-turn-helix transcriptional regulator [Phytomonospora endophytica]|uniref:DNA-binding MarR family transcriptional regulator n=1 Tax=Phytomonospora endophytica TaxID=714109 RepID=A0A841G220_9ACTN|nr:MarR family transcriptional regulator [Phytomonospora endophytica]MBB6039697.1 DNA-binding MarR family transcriptional regulator [Phytomonospora endophytica]GIG70966.1 MarR family transcriptional regulator [Phytomonospora endophytica]
MAATPETNLVERWRDVLTCYSAVSCALERALQDAHGLGMSEFEALDRIVDAQCEKRRMNELAADMYLSQSALSRAVARLERDGLVSRDMCAEDRRSIFVRITDTGRDKHAQARETQRAVLAEHFA